MIPGISIPIQDNSDYFVAACESCGVAGDGGDGA